MKSITAFGTPTSHARSILRDRPAVRLGLVQHRWREDSDELAGILNEAIGQAADLGAEAVFLPELTLSKYPADQRASGTPGDRAEDLHDGPTFAFAISPRKSKPPR